MSQQQQTSLRNRLLRVLGPNDFGLLAPAFEQVSLTLGHHLTEANQPLGHAYFIESGLISLLADTVRPGANRVEIGIVGFEGMVGLPIVLGTRRSPHVALVQAEGRALAIPAPVLDEALNSSRTLRGVLGRYAQSLIVQVGQTVCANADFNIEARLARWIVMTQDRLGRDDLPLTHEFLSLMLGVRRPGVTTATHMLEGAGMIRAQRGRITVLDRGKLLELAEGSYGGAEAEYERLLEEG
ncbi:Crp/Fnr family transcriptional regulator [Methylobacterium brachythecii]|uniref:CRP-like cAMP-binding protein n=1 Tax=Methylobacterium brachythecii TaxID=1176177 RepID=A0A7W6AIF8_9HYPH|nr:Crp/Fnr family transcriptional regulator [Methylobacterium brachythecii]MBB3902184.1 CRP-like cAMP-binding protein [Methylobacterium brachythecii]GLS42029.1 cyclic nucleotide-binding protein [Methylobacterium brachythecii]